MSQVDQLHDSFFKKHILDKRTMVVLLRLCFSIHQWTWRWLHKQHLQQWGYWKSVVMINANFFVLLPDHISIAIVHQVCVNATHLARLVWSRTSWGFDCVFVPFLWSALMPFTTKQLFIQKAPRNVILLHVNDLDNPSNWCLDEYWFDEGWVHTV